MNNLTPYTNKVLIENEIHFLEPNQKWMPRRICNEIIGFHVGQFVVSKTLSSMFQLTDGMIESTRVFKYTRYGKPITQVKIYNNDKWFASSHFTAIN